jgi:hypothetical protein
MNPVLLGLGLHLGAGFLRFLADSADLVCKVIAKQPFC